MVKKRLNNIYKIMNVILCSVLMFLFASCKASYVPSEEAETIMSSKWYDIFDGDEIVNDGMREIELEEFPGVTFRAYFGGIEATVIMELFIFMKECLLIVFIFVI